MGRMRITMKAGFANNSAAMGIGTIIIFIAIVLVAGIAASVLIQTSISLEMQTLRTGSEITESIGGGLAVIGVEGYNSSGRISLMAIEIKLRSGSPDIDLSSVMIELSNSRSKHVLTYDKTKFTYAEDTQGDLFNAEFYPTGSKTTFGVIVLQDADGSCTSLAPTIGYGDHVILCISTEDIFSDTSGLLPRIYVEGRVITEVGGSGNIVFTTPPAYIGSVIDLQ